MDLWGGRSDITILDRLTLHDSFGNERSDFSDVVALALNCGQWVHLYPQRSFPFLIWDSVLHCEGLHHALSDYHACIRSEG